MPIYAEELTELMGAALARAVQRWPSVRFSRADCESFAQHIHGARSTPADFVRFGDEFLLSRACARGDAAAIAVFERDYVGRVAPTIARVSREPDFVAEVTQELREHLLLGPSARVASYAGTGPLMSWVRIVARRTALNGRRAAPCDDIDAMSGALIEEACAEHGELPRYRAAVDAALREAFNRLELQQRNLLRLHYIERRSIDQLGVMHRVHRATIARWLVEARGTLFRHIERTVSSEVPVHRFRVMRAA